jgi:hypothetical protein
MIGGLGEQEIGIVSLPVQPASSKRRQLAGVACMIEISFCSRRRRKRYGSRAVARSTMTTVAPT